MDVFKAEQGITRKETEHMLESMDRTGSLTHQISREAHLNSVRTAKTTVKCRFYGVLSAHQKLKPLTR